ncbi:MAG TPA: hypothetical protein VNH18_34660, partial [Bryobacteraceae bacterium]|nr:hypothetical protein [Bryobacteraceae bacterium]
MASGPTHGCLPVVSGLRTPLAAGLWMAVLVPAMWGQDAFLAVREAVRAAQPAGVEFGVAAPGAKFYLGETIPLTLSFRAEHAGSFVADSRLQDRVGRLNWTDEFVVDPAGASEDPLRGLPGETGGMGGLSGGNAILRPEKAFTVERILNEWVRFRGPGIYRVYVRSRRVRQVAGAGRTDMELQGYSRGAPVELVSNVLRLEIVAAPAEWVARQITEATAVLDGPVGNDSASGLARLRAGLALRFLNTTDAGTALAKRLPGVNTVDAFALHMGMLDSSHRAELLPVMERLLTDPRQGISDRFLVTLAQLAVLVEAGGVIEPYPAEAGAQKVWQAESQRRAALYGVKRQELVVRLLDALAGKTPEARALTRDALLTVAEGERVRPAWLSGIAESLVADFLTLPTQMQAGLLDSRWRLLRNNPNVLPLLLDLYNNPPPRRNGEGAITDLVVRRIYELAPARGRELILANLHRQEGSPLDTKTLMSLPDESLPELNGVFAAWAARGGPLPGQLITRYATGEIVKEVEAGYLKWNAELERQRVHNCPFPLVFYFLKFDPDFGARELRETLQAGPCVDIGRAFSSLGAWAMSPALERLAIENLTSPSVAVKRGAAEVLGKYGSAAA